MDVVPLISLEDISAELNVRSASLATFNTIMKELSTTATEIIQRYCRRDFYGGDSALESYVEYLPSKVNYSERVSLVSSPMSSGFSVAAQKYNVYLSRIPVDLTTGIVLEFNDGNYNDYEVLEFGDEYIYMDDTLERFGKVTILVPTVSDVRGFKVTYKGGYLKTAEPVDEGDEAGSNGYYLSNVDHTLKYACMLQFLYMYSKGKNVGVDQNQTASGKVKIDYSRKDILSAEAMSLLSGYRKPRL